MEVSQDSSDKKKLSNEKRLRAIKEQQRKRKQMLQGKIYPKTEIESRATDGNKIKLFDSDGKDDISADMFKIKPQFEGPSGQQLFEMNSELSDRFKLDERFRENDDIFEDEAAEGEEKSKNLKILESLLGHEVSEKHINEKSFTKVELPRFDPDNENSAKYLKQKGVGEEKPTKKSRKRRKIEDQIEEVPVSAERYIEVSKNLKDILSSTSNSFSIASKFNVDETVHADQGVSFSFQSAPVKESSFAKNENGKFKALKNENQGKYPPRNTFETKHAYTFFISKEDTRLKEGIEFFRRHAPLDQLREEWGSKQKAIKEVFRKKRISSERRFKKKHSTTQRKKAFIKR